MNTLLCLQAAAVFDLESGRCVGQLAGHKGAVSGAAFSADGALVATCSADASLRVWRAATSAASLPPLPYVHAACEYSSVFAPLLQIDPKLAQATVRPACHLSSACVARLISADHFAHGN